MALPTDWFADMNADIRLSASSVRLGNLTASNAAASVSLRDGRLEIGLGQAVFGGGSLTGDLAVTDSAEAAAIEAQLRANEIAFALAPATLGLPQAISGTASVLVDVSTKGGDLGSLLGELAGTARINVKDGAVPLFGLADVAASAGGPAEPDPAQGSRGGRGRFRVGGLQLLRRRRHAGARQRRHAILFGRRAGLDRPPRRHARTERRDQDRRTLLQGVTTAPTVEPIGFSIGGTLAAPAADRELGTRKTLSADKFKLPEHRRKLRFGYSGREAFTSGNLMLRQPYP